MASTLMAGVVRVRPDLDEFVRDMKSKTSRAMKESSREVNQQVRQDASKTGKAVGDAVADGVNQGTRTAASSLDKLSERADKMKDIGSKMTVGITAPVIAGFTAASTAFADVQDAQNMVDVMFGESAQKVRDFGKNAYDNLGIAEQTALRLSGTLGSLTTSFQSQQEAADSTLKLIERSADMASVFGGTNEMAAEAITSALRGEMDPIERYGVVLNEAAVQAKALQMGLGGVAVDQTKVNAAQLNWEKAVRDSAEAEKEHGASSLEARQAQQDVIEAEEKLAEAVAGSGGEIDAAAKKTAIMALIMEQTDRTAGDLQATWDSTANATKRNAEGAKELAAEFGENLDPAVQNFMETASKVLDFFNDLPEGVQTTLLIIGGIGALLGPALVAIGTLAGAWVNVRNQASLAAIAQQQAMGAAGGGLLGGKNKGKGGKLGVLGYIPHVAAGITGYQIGSAANDAWGISDQIANGIVGDRTEVIPWFDEGGVMPGPKGKHSLAMVAGGETIVPTHKPGVELRSGNGSEQAALAAVVADLASQVASLAALPRTVNAEIHREMTSRDVGKVFNGASRDAKNRALRPKRNT